VAQADQLGPKVGGRLSLFYSHQMNRVNSHNSSAMTKSTIDIIMAIAVNIGTVH